MAKQLREYPEGDTFTADTSNAAGATAVIVGASPSVLAQQREKLAAQIAEINTKLEVGKDSELNRLKLEVASFNVIFGTSYIVTEEHMNAEPKVARKCTVCRQSGHRSNVCPEKTAQA